MYTILNPALIDDPQINIKSHKKTIKSKVNDKQDEK